MGIDWIFVNQEKPKTAKRMLVCYNNGKDAVMGKLTVHGWVDDNSIPLRNVIAYSIIELPSGEEL